MSCDPVGTIDGLNLFTFVKNNPINGIDTRGLETEPTQQKAPTKDILPAANTNYGGVCSNICHPKVFHNAWEVENLWTDDYIQEYRDYVQKKSEEYRKSGVELTCEDFALTLMMDFAREHHLPFVITNETGTFDASDPKYLSYDDFKRQVLKTTGSRDLQRDSNAVVVPFTQAQPGDLIINRNKALIANHIQVISSITKVELSINETRKIIGIHQGTAGILNARPGASRLLEAGDPNSPYYTGKPIELGRFDTFVDYYENSSTGATYLQFSEKKRIQARSWNFSDWNARLSEYQKDVIWRETVRKIDMIWRIPSLPK